MRKRNDNYFTCNIKAASVLLFITFINARLLLAQDDGKIAFRDYTPVENIDSLETAVSFQKNNPGNYMAGLAKLERSRQQFDAEKFGNGLSLLDSLSKKYNRADVQAAYYFLAAEYEDRKKQDRITSLQYFMKALDLFAQQKDTSGIIRCYYYLVALNIDSWGSPTGDTLVAETYMKKIAALAATSDWAEDKLYNLFAQQRYYYRFWEKEADTLLRTTQQALDIIDANPGLYYIRPGQLNFLAIAYGFKKDVRKALALHLECLRLCKDKWYQSKITYLGNIANDYRDLNELEKAREYYMASYNLIKLYHQPAANQLDALDGIATTLIKEKKYKEGWEYHVMVDSLYEVVEKEMKNRDFSEMQVKYEIEKKEQANKTLQKEKRTYETGILASFLLLSIISVLLFYLYRKNKQLDEYAQFRDRIFTIISHDLRSPINAFEGLSKQAAYLMKRGETDTMELVGQKIDASVFQMNRLLNNLLAWAISQHTKTDMRLESLQVLNMVNEILLLYADVVAEKNTTVTVNIDDNILVTANKNGLEAIVRNLIDNAIKHAVDGQVIIAAEEENNQVVLQVINDSVITSEEAVLKIQNQLRGVKTSYMQTTTNFGLQLVAYFIKLHKGSVTMRSNANEGTVFTIALPA